MQTRRTDTEELEHMQQLTARERKHLAEWLKQLCVIESKSLYAARGASSLWEYVRAKLGYSEGSASKRVQVMHAANRFPLIYDYLSEQKVCLTVVSRLCPHLTQANHYELLERSVRKSVREVEQILVSLSPKPDVKDSIRKAVPTSPATLELAAKVTTDTNPTPNVPTPTPAPQPPKPPFDAKPLSPSRYHVNFTIGQQTKTAQEKLKAVTRHLSHPPSMEDIYQAGLETLLKKYDPDIVPKRKSAPKPTASQAPRSRYISRDKKRAVRKVAHSQCMFVAPDGTRCTATSFLQIDHIVPFAQGGTNELGNLQLLCRAHNQWRAIQTYGHMHMSQWLSAQK